MPIRPVAPPTPADLERARAVVAEHLRPTPLVDTGAAPGALLKLESWQPTGAFKVRGALAALSALPEEVRARGVVAASAGNHALGVAFAAARLGVAATIVVPATASAAKVAALERFPVRLVQHGDDYDAAERHALALAAEGFHYLSGYNDPHVIAGQATIGPELRAHLDGPLTVVAPAGGGGLSSGLGLWAAGEQDVRVVAVEAEASRALSASVAAGRVVEVPVGPTLADGLAGNLEPGSITPALVAAHVHAFTSVTEDEIRAAMRYLATDHGLVAEASGAVPVAALLTGKVPVHGRAVAVVTGRNIALPTLAAALA
jgi:threonine dehydratase